MVKFSGYSIKSETVVHRFTKKAVLKSFKKFTEKHLYIGLQLHLKKDPVQVFSNRFAS